MTYRIGLATTGGDAPGMNTCIRAIVKGARSSGIEIMGIQSGALGLLRNVPSDYRPLTPEDVTFILDRSGTFLGTARDRQVVEYLVTLPSFRGLGVQPYDLLESVAGQTLVGELAQASLAAHSINALILIGGDTTCRAAVAISEVYRRMLPVAVVPATIDNDVAGTTQTLGFDSAVSAAVQAVDAIRASAMSHSRIFIVEVMGRNHGYIALETALACGAEEVLIPEYSNPREIDQVCKRLLARRKSGQSSAIIIVAEGVKPAIWGAPETLSRQPAMALRGEIERRIPDWEVRISVLGHLQRGAVPTLHTRTLAARLGVRALDIIVNALQQGKATKPILIGVTGRGSIRPVMIQSDMVRTPTREMSKTHKLIRRLAY